MQEGMKGRLTEFLAYLKIGQKKFEVNCGLSNGFVDKIKDNATFKTIDKISNAYPQLNIEWLTSGVGEMLKSDTIGSADRISGAIRYWVDIDATGGDVMMFDDTISNRHIDLQIPEFRDCTDAVNLYGDSMSPRYKSGQIIILKEWRESFIEFGNVYLVITKNGHRTVKYLRRAEGKNEILCVSENPDYDPFVVNRDDISKIYIVKGAIEKTTL